MDQFWNWYAQHAARFHATIEDGRCGDLSDEVSSKVNELFPSFAWVFGPGENKGEHSFTLSAEGVVHRRLLTSEWLKRAPKINGWSFYASRQRSDSIEGYAIRIRDREYKPNEFWATPSIDEEAECIDITVWNPVFKELEEKDCYQILFIWLDEALGEDCVSGVIGHVNIGEGELAESMPLTELHSYVESTLAEREWPDKTIGELWSGYQMKAPCDDHLRTDVIAGSTCHMGLNNEYLRDPGQMEDPIQDVGAQYVFVRFPVHNLDDGKQSDQRGELEEKIEAALSTANAGILLGGAIGTVNTYMDWLLYDAPAGIKIIRDSLKNEPRAKGFSIHPFAGKSDVPL